MNDRKIVFLDIDGTLYDNVSEKIPESSVRGVKEMSEDGNIDLVIATGRPYFMIHHLDPIRPYIKAYVLLNGQYVLYDDQVIYENPLPVEPLKRLEEKARKLHLAMGFVGKHQAYVTEKNDIVRTDFKAFNIEPVINLENSTFDYQMPVFQAWIFAPSAVIDDIKKEINVFDYMHWGKSGCDVIMRGASKKDGILKLIERLGYAKENTYAFGDAENDIQMFRCCAHSVAMGNASDEVKRHATMTTDRIEQDGLYKGFIKCGLLKTK